MTNIFRFSFLFILVTVLFSSCKKGCDLPKEETRSGEIIKDAYVLGYNTGGAKLVQYNQDTNNIRYVSFDKGYSYVPIDFSKYSIMSFPVSVGCNTYFDKNVEFDQVANKVTYTLGVDSCPDCEEQYYQDNWVLVNKIPQNYFVVFKRN